MATNDLKNAFGHNPKNKPEVKRVISIREDDLKLIQEAFPEHGFLSNFGGYAFHQLAQLIKHKGTNHVNRRDSNQFPTGASGLRPYFDTHRTED